MLRDRKDTGPRRLAQRNHLGLALRAFLRLEANRLENGVSWYEAKRSIVRDAVRRYLAALPALFNCVSPNLEKFAHIGQQPSLGLLSH